MTVCNMIIDPVVTILQYAISKAYSRIDCTDEPSGIIDHVNPIELVSRTIEIKCDA